MVDPILTLAKINKARSKLNQLNSGVKIRNDEEACRFINERGFVLLMPIEGIPLPSLSEADEAKPWPGFATTDRAWAWKETLPGSKSCAYTKLIHGRGTFICWRLYPSFLRIYGPEGDPDYEYENGRMNLVEKDLISIVAEYGPIDSRELWLKAKNLFGGKRNRFTAALELLQSRFFFTVAGGSLEGWTLHTWDLVERQVPPEVIGKLPILDEARVNLLRQTIRNCLAAPERKLCSILRWPPADLHRCVEILMNEGTVQEIQVAGEKISWLGFCASDTF